MSFTFNLKLKRLFFDRAHVAARLGKRKAKFLSLAGRDVRQEARKLLGQPSKKAQPRSPGKPPRVHTSDPVATLRNILYASDGAESVIIGPVGLNHQVQNSQGSVPALLEYGGTARVREKRVGGQWVPVGKRQPRPGQPARTRTARYGERPYMRPARDNVLARYARKRKYPGLSVGVQIGPAGGVEIGPAAA